MEDGTVVPPLAEEEAASGAGEGLQEPELTRGMSESEEPEEESPPELITVRKVGWEAVHEQMGDSIATGNKAPVEKAAKELAEELKESGRDVVVEIQNTDGKVGALLFFGAD